MNQTGARRHLAKIAVTCSIFTCLGSCATQTGQEQLFIGLPGLLEPLPENTESAIPIEDPPAVVMEMMQEISPANIRRLIDQLSAFGTRHTLSETESDTRGIGAARRFIKSEFEQYAADSGRTGESAMKVYFDSHMLAPDGRRISREVEIVNVIAEIPGSSPEARGRRYYVIGHYDSRASSANDFESDAPGANDDASGVAMLMELARVMSKREFDATLVFMATAGEEQGLFGARLHAEVARANDRDIRAVLNNDTVGDPTDLLHPDLVRNSTVRVFSEAVPAEFDERSFGRMRALGGETDSKSRQLARYMFEVAVRHIPVADDGRLMIENALAPIVVPRLVYRTDRFLRGGDHTAFNQFGYPAVRLTEVAENYDRQHQDVRFDEATGTQYGDLPEYVDEDYVAAVGRLNLATLAHLANAPSAPANVRMITASLDNKTTLRWEAALEPDLAGYETVWRETTSPYWQFALKVKGGVDATEHTIPVSKDNFFMGVRSYDTEGYRSPVTFASAARR